MFLFVDGIFFVVNDDCCVKRDHVLRTFFPADTVALFFFEAGPEDPEFLAPWSRCKRGYVRLVERDDFPEALLSPDDHDVICKRGLPHDVLVWHVVFSLLCPMLGREKP